MHSKTLGKRTYTHKSKSRRMVKIIIFSILLIIIGTMIWIFNEKPLTLQNKLGGKIAAVEWDCENGEPAESLALWTIQKTYPGSINKEEKATGIIKNGKNKTLSEVTIFPKNQLILIDGQIYLYQINPKEDLLLKLSRKIDNFFLK